MTKKIAVHLNYILHAPDCPEHCARLVVSESFKWKRQHSLECPRCHAKTFLPQDGTDWEWEWDHEDCDLNPRIFDAWRQKVAALEAELGKALKVQSADAKKWYDLYDGRGKIIDLVAEERDAARKEVEELKSQLDVAIACARAIRKDRDELRAEVNRLTGEVAGRAQGNAVLSQANDALAKERDDYKAKYLAEKGHHAYYRDKVSLYMASEQDFIKELDRVKREWDVSHGANEALVKERLELKAKLREEQEQNKVLLEANKRLAGWRADLLRDLNTKTDECSRARLQLSRAEKEIERLQRKVDPKPPYNPGCDHEI